MDFPHIANDPLRRRIIEAIGNQNASIADLSERLDICDARVHYHIGRLAEAGIVQLNDRSDDPRLWTCSLADIPLPVPDQNSRGFEVIPSRVANDFDQSYRELKEGLFGHAATVLLGRESRTRLSEEQAIEFRRRVQALADEYFLPGRGDQTGVKYGFFAVLSPIDIHPLGDSLQRTSLLAEDRVADLAESVFVDDADVYLAYSPTDRLVRVGGAIDMIQYLRTGTGRVHLVVRYPDCAPDAQSVAIEPNTYGSPGADLKRTAEGWGLIHVELAAFEKGKGVICRVSVNTKERALGPAGEVYVNSGDPGAWCWTHVYAHAER
ncbi:MAG: winged helix-turn-helix domain-containing protein [Gammaproteobacteria bacterium]|nr:winged helix-turn-helix domain-containing protein [Gammaproteobacteria bacterium]